ncbi:LOB domain-containing protein 37-like protein [Tanacetum coccineum]
MSCNGCRVLRKGCSDTCILRPCLQWIDTPEAQGHATVFLAKFFGRAGLMSFISAVPLNQRPSLFQSLLFEAAGRTVNPVNGAVGLLWTGNWHVCQASVDTVLRGGTLRPIPELMEAGSPAVVMPKLSENNNNLAKVQDSVKYPRSKVVKRRRTAADLDLNENNSEESSVTTTCLDLNYTTEEGRYVHLLNLFK